MGHEYSSTAMLPRMERVSPGAVAPAIVIESASDSDDDHA